MKDYIIRILVFVLALVLFVISPWWLSILIAIGLTIYFPFYLEVLFFGFLFDVLYSVRFSFPYTGLMVATTLLLSVMFIKTRIRR